MDNAQARSESLDTSGINSENEVLSRSRKRKEFQPIPIANWEWAVLEHFLTDTAFETFDLMWSKGGLITARQVSEITGEEITNSAWTGRMLRMALQVARANLGFYIESRENQGSVLLRHNKHRRTITDGFYGRN